MTRVTDTRSYPPRHPPLSPFFLIRPSSGAGRWCAAVYGGAKAKPQLLALAGGVEVLVATPGRLVEFLSSGLVGLDRCSHLVLDEADRMLGKENEGGGGGGLGLFQFSF